LDRDENKDEDAHGGDIYNEDRELDDNDDNRSDSEDETEGTTNLEPPDMSTDNAPVKVTHNCPTKHTQQPPNPLAIANPILNPISHYPSASTRSHTHLPPITISARKHTDVEAKNIIVQHELEKMWQEKETALMHATMAHLEVDEMATKLNTRNCKGKCGGPIFNIISACRTQRFCGRLSTTSHDCDHNGHSQC
jgi:hypothetical protein